MGFLEDRRRAYQDVRKDSEIVVEFRRPIYVDRIRTGEEIFYGAAIEVEHGEPIDGDAQGLMAVLFVPAESTDAAGEILGEELVLREGDVVAYDGRVGTIRESGRIAPGGVAVGYSPKVFIERPAV